MRMPSPGKLARAAAPCNRRSDCTELRIFRMPKEGVSVASQMQAHATVARDHMLARIHELAPGGELLPSLDALIFLFDHPGAPENVVAALAPPQRENGAA